jgi:intraflagellar transport protein 56
MMLSKRGSKKPKVRTTKSKSDSKEPKLEDYIKKRDYTGAIALLEFQIQTGDEDPEKHEWLGYCAFHMGEYRKAMESYEKLLEAKDGNVSPVTHLNIACCLFYEMKYKKARAAAKKGPSNAMQNRLLFHIAHKLNDENALMQHHQALTDSAEDQLSLAAIHYLRGHYQEATDIYKRLLLDNRDDLALNVYVAMCYYKLDYYDVSLEILAVYLQAHPESAVALNLKACNHFRLYNGKAAAAELKSLSDASGATSGLDDNDLIRHNMVVFRNGTNALQVLPSLVDFLPEARLNLVIYYLRNDDVQEAFELLKDLEPSTPQEYILKGVVNANIGQATGSREHLKMAQQYFQLVGASASESDTIPGRQCMASCFFLLKQFEDVNIYLKSIKAYLYNDDNFNWNYGISLAATKQYKEAEETLLLVQSESLTREYCYLSWLARCYIYNKKPQAAWELYLKMDTSNESFNLLQLIANGCYEMGQFYYSAKAFDVLERLDPDPEYWEGKRGACVGVLQKVIAREQDKDKLRDIVGMLRNTQNPQVDFIVGTIKKWCDENGVSGV